MTEINTIVEKSPKALWDGESVLKTNPYPLEEAPYYKDQNLSTGRKPKLKELCFPQNQLLKKVFPQGQHTEADIAVV